MDVQGLHKLIDDWAAAQSNLVKGEHGGHTVIGFVPPTTAEPEVPADERVLPEGKRVVRTRSSGDRVYLLDDEKKTRAWVTKAELLDALGFTMADVKEIEDNEMIKYQMVTPIYKAD